MRKIALLFTLLASMAFAQSTAGINASSRIVEVCEGQLCYLRCSGSQLLTGSLTVTGTVSAATFTVTRGGNAFGTMTGSIDANFVYLTTRGWRINGNTAGTALYIDSGAIVVGSGQYTLNGNTVSSTTAPTISSGFGTSPSVTTNNGTAAFTINVGTGGVATSGVIGLPAATNGWWCGCENLTTPGANRTRMTASTSTSCTVTNVAMSTGAAAAWTASDVLHCAAVGR